MECSQGSGRAVQQVCGFGGVRKGHQMIIKDLADKCLSSVDDLVSLLDQLAADADETAGATDEQIDAIRAALNDAITRIEKTQ